MTTRQWRRFSAPATLLAAAVLAAGCGGGGGEGAGGGGGGEGASGATLETMVKIRDRAVAEGFEALECKAIGQVECVGDISVVSSGDEVESAGLFLLKDGLWSQGPDYINVDANPDPQDLRAAEEAQRDDAAEMEWLKKGEKVYVIVGDRLWSTYAPGVKIPKQKFLDIVGKLEGCAPSCHFTEPNTAKPAAKPEGPELGPATSRQAAAAFAPIVRRSKAAGYTVTPPSGSVVVVTGEGTEGIVSVYAVPAGARDMGRLSAGSIERGEGTVDEYAVIDNRIWETYSPDEAAFRQLVETAEGCAPNCHFSMSSFNP